MSLKYVQGRGSDPTRPGSYDSVYIKYPEEVKSKETESRWVAATGSGEVRMGSHCFMALEFYCGG